jgi:hypothetical protein
LTFVWDTFLGKYLFIFLEDFLHGSCLVKNLTNARSYPCEEKSTGPGVNFWEQKKEKKDVGPLLIFCGGYPFTI